MRTHHTYILIDALDEAPAERCLRDDVLDAIHTMRGWSLQAFHLMVTSRDIPEIRGALDPPTEEAVAVESDKVRDDIRQYVSYHVDHDPRLRRWQEHRQTIKDYLVKHADGVFRWVICQLEPLRRCPLSQYDLHHCLSRLPSTLDATYERMLSEIDEFSRERARNILVLLCLAPRELTVSELIEAITVDIDELERYDPARKLGGLDDLLRICPGLIDVLDDSEWSSSPKPRQIVRVAHFSVQEYLMSDRIRKGRAASFAISETADHARISKTCIIYLCHDDFVGQALTPRLLEHYAFARCAARYWFHHFRQDCEHLTGNLQAWGITLCATKSNFNRWVALWDAEKSRPRMFYWKIKDEVPLSAIYYLACIGLHSLILHPAMNLAARVNAQGGSHGCPLQAASSNNHEKVVRVLIAAGADIDAQGGNHGNALNAAPINGHERVVQVLITLGADVNARTQQYATALVAASRKGHEKVVRLLIAAGVNVNAGSEQRSTALFAALEGGHEKVVRMLLAAGADVGGYGPRYSNALYAASRKNREQVVQVLIEAGADVNVPAGYFGNALQAASVRGHEKVVQTLIAAGADVNAQGRGRYVNALSAASERGHEEVIRMLADAGATMSGPAEMAQLALRCQHMSK